MRRVRNATDGRVHFSELKRMLLSPAHYKAACEAPRREPTRPMRVGTTTHRILLGARPGHGLVVWDGQRKGGDWLAFKAQNKGVEIITADEAIEAQAIADAAGDDPMLQELLAGAACEVPLQWLDAGIECATSGVDILGAVVLADLKNTTSTEPRRWQAHALAMQYHAQAAFYLEGARQNGHAPKRLVVIGIEIAPPFAVVPLELTPAMVEAGRKCTVLWLERLRSCEENDHWPSYTQSPIPWDPPEWMTPAELDEAAEDADAFAEAVS